MARLAGSSDGQGEASEAGSSRRATANRGDGGASLSRVTAFFVPGAQAEEQEQRYAELAELAAACAGKRPTPRRIRAVRFEHDGEEWAARVGEQLTGEQEELRSRRTRQEFIPPAPRIRHLADPATVLAIFDAGHVYLVVTDKVPVGSSRSRWENPFLVNPRAARSLQDFDPAIPTAG